MNLKNIDFIVIIIYFIAIIAIGILSKISNKSTNRKLNFIIAGRGLTLPLFVATLVATWYGLILGMGEFIYSQGIVAWTCLGLPYYIAAVLFALFIAEKIRHSQAVSIPEQISLHFGTVAGKVSSYLVLLITIPAAYILMLGILLELITGWNSTICLIIGTAVSVGYLFTGGFISDVKTNALQFVLMYIGFGVLLFFSVLKYGSPTEMLKLLPSSHKNLTGLNSWQVIVTWFIISLQTFIDPSFHQRSAAAKTPLIAKKGILISVSFWIIFDFLTISTGLYSRAFLNVEPIMSFPALGAEVLPTFWNGLFVVSLLATVMSSLNSYAFLSGVTIGNDILLPFLKTKKTSEYWTRIGLVISSILGISMAVCIPSAVQLIYKAGSIAVPGLLLPLMLGYSSKKRISDKSAIHIMVCSSLLSATWMILPTLPVLPSGIEYFLQGIEPMIPGILCSIVLYLIFSKRFVTH